MWVKEIMKTNLVTCFLTSSIQEVARKMKEEKIGSVLITDQGGELKGILTDRDITLAVADGKDPVKCRADEIMSQDLATSEVNSDLDAALRIMSQKHTRRLPITDKGKLVGILSTAEVAHAMKTQIDQFFELEEAYIRSGH